MAGIEKLSTVRFSKLIEHKEGELHEIISAGSNAI